MNSPFTNRIRRNWSWLAPLMVLLVTLALRLYYVENLTPVERTPLWDAERYWEFSQQIRSQLCTTFAYCTPQDHAPIHVGQFLVLGRDGLLPILIAALVTVFPDESSTAYFAFIVTETLTCLMVYHILLRLRFPIWVAVLAALLYATYTPTIVGSAMLLQQPLIRFALVATLWAYTLAITTQRSWLRFAWVGLGTLWAAVIGFSSVTTRPLMTIIPVAVLLLALMMPRLRAVVVPQMVWLAVLTAGILWTVAYMVSLPDSTGFMPSLLQLLTSISPDSNLYTQVTVLAFPYFWAPTNWFAVPQLENASLTDDLTREPGNFLYWWVFSIVGNWRYPDTLMLGTYFLTLGQQQVWHVALLVTGLVGLAWLVGQTGARRFITLLMLVAGGYLTLAYSAITIEPRRLSALMPLLALAAAVALYSLIPVLRQRLRALDLLLLLACVMAWIMPLSVWILFLPDMAWGHAFWVMARFVFTAAVIGWLLMRWRQQDETRVLPILPAIGLLTSLTLVCIVHFQDSDWRTWTTPVTTPVRQTINNIALRDDLHPWLLVDVVHQSETEALEIRLNGQVVKAVGEPMVRWEAGLPPLWIPYDQLAERSDDLYRAAWFALPLTREQMQAPEIEVVLQSDVPVMLRGDHMNMGEPFAGPLFDPWNSGHSLWRWLANATDARIPWQQPLNGDYASARLNVENGGWERADLSVEIGRQNGLYRIFIVQAAFGSHTNALTGGRSQTNGMPLLCDLPLDETAPGATLGVQVCMTTTGDARFTLNGQDIGETPFASFIPTANQHERINQLHSEHGYVDVLYIYRTLFVANFYSADGDFIYSYAFAVYPEAFG